MATSWQRASWRRQCRRPLARITLRSTVSATEIGSLAYPNVFGLATGDTGLLYGAAGTQIFTVNTTTGHGSAALLDYSGHGLESANGSAFATEAVPEPASVSLAILGLSAAGLVAWLAHWAGAPQALSCSGERPAPESVETPVVAELLDGNRVANSAQLRKIRIVGS